MEERYHTGYLTTAYTVWKRDTVLVILRQSIRNGREIPYWLSIDSLYVMEERYRIGYLTTAYT